LRLHLAHELGQVIQIIAAGCVRDDFQRSRISIIYHQITGANDHFQLQTLRQFNRSGVGCRQIELKDVRLREHGREDQEKNQDHHHVDHRHDVQIIAPLVVAGVIAADEARRF
jgi:hypothetical protein